MKRKTADIEND